MALFDGLTQKILEGDTAALNLVKTMLNTPALINLDMTQGSVYAVPLDCETYSQSGSAQVSESLLIIKNGKKNIADNVAPGPWTWSISGYITGNPQLEPVSFYTPLVKLNTDIVSQWFEQGAVLVFKDMDAKIHRRVVIESLTVTHDKECANAAPFSMTLKELNVIGDSVLDKISSAVQPGSVWGNVLTVGTSVTALTAGTAASAVSALSALVA